MDFDADDSVRWTKPKVVRMKTEFVLISPVFGEVPLSSCYWRDVPGELHDKGWVNTGKVKVVERTYKPIAEETRLIDTDY